MKIVMLEGEALHDFLEDMTHLASNDGGVYRLRVAIDDLDGGFKWKANDGAWSPPRGQIQS